MSTTTSTVVTPVQPERRLKRLHLWYPRRLSGLRRTMSTPVTRPIEQEILEVSNGDKVNEEPGVHEESQLQSGRMNFESVAHDTATWIDDAASTGTAFREEPSRFDNDGEWAQNLFYAYARRSDDPRFSRFLLTFANACICAEWWSLVQQHFGGAPSNTREAAQFFSFSGDDLLGRAWKHHALAHLKTKWMYSQIGDAVGTMGKGQEIIPLQDDRGFLISAGPTIRSSTPDPADIERAPSRAASLTDSLGQREKTRPFRRASKRDSGILLPSSPLTGHERSFSMPINPAVPDAPSFDFARMEQNLSRIERLMEANASQLRSLEHVQAANLERLTGALVQNAEMVRELGTGQKRLGEVCDELRKAVKEKEEQSERISLRSMPSEPSVPSVRSGSLASNCGHEVKRGPRKIGRTVVGYIYADELEAAGKKGIGVLRDR